MNTERDYFFILGLQPGASPAEIKSAFRRLVKLYHPDHDQSLDAEVKYKEIRTAYKALLNKHSTDEKNAGPATSSYSSGQTAQGWEAYVDLDDFVYGREKTTEQVSFSLSDLPAIFWYSLTGARLFLIILGSVPVLMIKSAFDAPTWYMIISVVLIFAICFLIAYLERCGSVEDTTASRMFFWFPLMIPVLLLFYFTSMYPRGYVLLVSVCIIGLLVPSMPSDYLTKSRSSTRDRW